MSSEDNRTNDSSSDSDDNDTLVDCLLRDPVCHKCVENIFSEEELISCSGGCYRKFHKSCVLQHIHDGKFFCSVCNLDGMWCFFCHMKIEPGVSFEKCETKECNNAFHSYCIANIEEKQMSKFSCSHHYCLVCSIEERNPTCGEFLPCIKCTAAYHKNDRCIPAGTVLLNNRWIICTDHQNKSSLNKKTNVNFCFLCGQGGVLLCCETCPCAVHMECYGLEKTPDGSFMCSNCECGRKPMYGDIVWAKYGAHKWWPAEICHPLKVPLNLDKFVGDPGVFIVRFFGTLDYGPMTRRCVYPFQVEDEDDKNAKFKQPIQGKKYLEAVLDARRALLDRQHCHLSGMPNFVPIETNRYGAHVGRAIEKIDRDLTVCSCNPVAPNPCGDDDCQNRQVFIECNVKHCPAGEKCRNQRFTKRQYAPALKFMTIDRGFGLRALTSIQKGDFVIEYVGEVISRGECNRRLTNVDAEPDRAFYFLELVVDKIIDAGPMGNDSRFINHSCVPNCRTERWLVNGEYKIGLFASRDILAGEELTFHYNLDELNNFKTPCKCGAETCTGLIGKISKHNSSKSNGRSLNISAKKAKINTSTTPASPILSID